MKKVSLSFEQIQEDMNQAGYTGGCSGGRSDCCTRTCTRKDNHSDEDSLQSWDDYLEVNAGVLQY